MALHITLLGVVAATRDGEPVELGGPLPRGLLAVLALASPEPVTPERLLASVWGPAAPASGRDTLRAYLSRLRSAVGADHLSRTPSGYALEVDALDIRAFKAATTRARAAGESKDLPAARRALEEALALWTGPPLSGVTHLPFASDVVARLVEQRLQLSEDLLDVRLRQGEHVEVVAELRRLLDEAPLSERLAGLLMVALYRSGRQADALGVYSGLRARLVDELGIEPNVELRTLHQRILRQDAALLQMEDRAQGAPSTADPAAPDPRSTAAAAAYPISTKTAPTASAERDHGPTAASVATAAPVTAAPPPATSRRPCLPLPLTSFVGRTEELAEVARLLSLARLLTLTGAGGCGKTRLALEAARREQAVLGETPCVVELAGLDDPALLAGAVAGVLGITALAGQADAALLVDALRERELLLLLDSCEHLVEAVALLVQHLLERCPGVRILATSREPLGVPGERLLVVPSLRTASNGTPGEAEALFEERAAQALPDLALDDADRRLVARICADLDGIPLAIELAAARLHVLSLAQIADMLDDRFALLRSGSRTAQPRHRTLEAAVAWSHNLLEADERELFAAASVFRGGFTLDALDAVVGGGATLDVLSRLVAKSMVQVDALGAARRYRLLETLRDYGDRQLEEEERLALADRHAGWCADLVEEAERHLRTEADAPWWRRLGAEQHNLRAALRHALESGQQELAIRIAGSLGWYWYRRGPVGEGRRWLAAAVELGSQVSEARRAKAMLSQALLDYLAGEITAAAEHLRAAQAADDGGDPAVSALTHLYLAYFEAAFGSPESARELLAEAEERAAQAPPWVAVEVLMIRGQLVRAMGDAAGADALLMEGRRLGLARGHSWGAGSCGWIAAKVRLDAGRPADAAALLAENIDELAAAGDRTSTLACMHTAAAVAAALGHSEEGAVLLGAVDSMGERIGYSPLVMDPLDGERHRAMLTQRLSPEAFAAAQQRGRDLAPDAAVRLAIRLMAASLTGALQRA